MPDQHNDSPVSTYRLQFHGGFRFDDATRLVPYLDRLGVTHCYSSPYLMARPGSTHGYDICDHTRLNPEVGSREDYEAFVAALRARDMGQILDFVPNHMGIDPRTNPWWRDVLENGRSSAFARFFDIDWDPIKPELRGKILLPILGEQYGLVLERGELRLGFGDGALHLDYFEHHLPINPRQAVRVYEHALADLQTSLGEDDADLREYLSIMTALRNLPTINESEPGRIAERRREKEVARERLGRLVAQSPAVRDHIDRAVAFFNGVPGEPASFDSLHALLEQQAYRLSDWHSASHEINYRRFFDINALAALRMEDPEVFAATHVLVAELLAAGSLSGLRIDHPDGLFDPAAYFQRLQDLPRPSARLYVLAEKILSEGEALPEGWPIAGTTGYAFANQVTRLLMDPAGERPLRQFYERFTGRSVPFPDVAYESKKLITGTSLASELNVLAHALNQISESNRRSRDFTLESLRGVLQEVVSCFPVYRTYVREDGWTPSDRDRIEAAVLEARRRNPAIASSQFDFFREVVLPRRDSTDEAGGGWDRRDGYAPVDRAGYEKRLAFSMKLQQFTAPVQAKGVEDTAFYRYNLLISLNEVGGEPARFRCDVADVHAANEARCERWPLEMLTTATHDTKLGEDVRARITLLSEVVADWRRHVARWARINATHRTPVRGRLAPDRNDEYRFYQVLLGAWPTTAGAAPPAQAPDELVSRVREYMTKATKEAKVHTSWVNDNQAYDQAVARFVEQALAGPKARKFLASFVPFQARVAGIAVANSLAQLVLKLASPGIPDFYQGTELWDLNLVDPDNRRPVEFERRAQLLDALDPLLPDLGQPDAGSAAERLDLLSRLLDDWADGAIKLWVTASGLRLRRARPDLFRIGRYERLATTGPRADQLFAFARTHDATAALAVVPLLVSRLGDGWRAWANAWGTTAVVLPPSLSSVAWVNVLTGETIEGVQGEGGTTTVAAAQLMKSCPVALLASRGAATG